MEKNEAKKLAEELAKDRKGAFVALQEGDVIQVGGEGRIRLGQLAQCILVNFLKGVQKGERVNVLNYLKRDVLLTLREQEERQG